MSKKTILTIDNRTPDRIKRVSVRVNDDKDWDGSGRPDRCFDGASIEPFSYIRDRMELDTHWLTLCDGKYFVELHFEDGSCLKFDNCQKDATEVYNRECNTEASGPTKFKLQQISGPNVENDDPENLFRITRENTGHYKLSCWMEHVPDQYPVTHLAIPGTHDSCTYESITREFNFFQCQSKNIEDQLNGGVRYLDLRGFSDGTFKTKIFVNRDDFDGNKDCQICHGDSLLGRYDLTFRNVFDTVVEFLKENQSETVLIQIKRDGGSIEQIQKVMKSICEDYNDWIEDGLYWGAEQKEVLIDKKSVTKISGIPRLGDIRGKILLINRIGLDKGYKTDGWGDNVTSESTWLAVQDHYNFAKFSKRIDGGAFMFFSSKNKIKEVVAFHNKFASNKDLQGDGRLRLNFLSYSQWSINPDRAADQVNPKIGKYLFCQPGNYGSIFLIDYVGESANQSDALVDTIVSSNPMVW